MYDTAVKWNDNYMLFLKSVSLVKNVNNWLTFWLNNNQLNKGSVEKAMATHSSNLAWKIPWMEEPGGLQSMQLLRVRHDWVTSLSLFTLCIGEGNSNPLQCSCPENPRDRGPWWAAVYGVAESDVTEATWQPQQQQGIKLSGTKVRGAII